MKRQNFEKVHVQQRKPTLYVSYIFIVHFQLWTCKIKIKIYKDNTCLKHLQSNISLIKNSMMINYRYTTGDIMFIQQLLLTIVQTTLFVSI